MNVHAAFHGCKGPSSYSINSFAVPRTTTLTAPSGTQFAVTLTRYVLWFTVVLLLLESGIGAGDYPAATTGKSRPGLCTLFSSSAVGWNGRIAVFEGQGTAVDLSGSYVAIAFLFVQRTPLLLCFCCCSGILPC